jgi:hypothetical protein
MKNLKTEVECLIKSIEEARLKVNNYGLIFDFFDTMEKLDIFEGEWHAVFQDHFEHTHFVSMFGAEATGPEIRTSFCLNDKGDLTNKVQQLIYYNDDCKEIGKEDYNPQTDSK